METTCISLESPPDCSGANFRPRWVNWYCIVRYLYIIPSITYIMSNVQIIYRPTRSSVREVGCHICGKGLDDGLSVTAKTLHNSIVLFCDEHHKV